MQSISEGYLHANIVAKLNRKTLGALIALQTKNKYQKKRVQEASREQTSRIYKLSRQENKKNKKEKKIKIT